MWLARRLASWGLEGVAGALSGAVAVAEHPSSRAHVPSLCYAVAALCDELGGAYAAELEDRRVDCHRSGDLPGALRATAEKECAGSLWNGAAATARAAGLVFAGDADARHAWATALHELLEGEVWTRLLLASELWPSAIAPEAWSDLEASWDNTARDEAYAVLSCNEIATAAQVAIGRVALEGGAFFRSQHCGDGWLPVSGLEDLMRLSTESRRGLRVLLSGFLPPEVYEPEQARLRSLHDATVEGYERGEMALATGQTVKMRNEADAEARTVDDHCGACGEPEPECVCEPARGCCGENETGSGQHGEECPAAQNKLKD